MQSDETANIGSAETSTNVRRLLTTEHRARIEASCARASRLIAENDHQIRRARRMLNQIRASARSA